MRLGAKVSSEQIELLKKLSEIFDFIEVNYDINFLVNLNDFPKKDYVVHGPHYDSVVNLLKKENSKIEFVEKAIIFASKINSKRIVIHPGFYSDEEADEKNLYENLERLTKFSKKNNVKILIENMPLKTKISGSYFDEFGSTPKQIKFLLNTFECGFALDFSHAAHAAFSYKKDYKRFILEFMKLDPDMFHLYDTNINQETDLHLPLGKGNFDILFLLGLVGDKDVTLEIDPVTYENFVESMNYIKKLL